MKYEYRREAAASSTLNAKQLPGLPHDIELDFNHVHVRVHKSEWHDGYFSCSIAIPAHKDDEGYVLELDILDPTRPDEVDKLQEDTAPSLAAEFESGALGDWEYEAPLNDHNIDTIHQAMSCKFSDTTEQGRRLLTFNLTISGTPFSGYTLIHPNLDRAGA